MVRITQDTVGRQMRCWKPLYNLEDLEIEWSKSLNLWLDYIIVRTDEALKTETEFAGFDGGRWVASPQGIALQLNFHLIHHRAQV